MNEALHLRAMQKENPSLPFYQKTQNLREMHKNRQNSVDSISNIRFDVGMDARQMKKIIQYEALGRLKQNIVRMNRQTKHEVVGNFLDRNIATFAQVRRFDKVLDEMLESALANYPFEDVEFAFED